MDARKRLGVSFLWHMHQPFYKDVVTGRYMMPWVRLHGIKDYFPMAALVERFPDIKVVFNLVPSLVEQINDYVYNDSTDAFLDLTTRKASALSIDEKRDILDYFFRVNFKRFIEPNVRYAGLLIKKGIRPLAGSTLKDAINSFSDQDFLDLQVLFNMSWFHSLSIDDDVNLQELVAKNGSYTEEDKVYIIAVQKKILGRILPLYKKLNNAGRAEISTTPFYHPILPLVCDTSIAKVSSPRMELPKRFCQPDDAAWQVREAVKYHTQQFGSPPRGMWPSEGSVSDEALEIMMSNGIEWAATDEDILFNSLSMCDKRYNDGKLFDRRIIYRPYNFRSGSKRMAMIFRDKNLSDMISFSYNAWKGSEAAWDLIGHLKTISGNLRRDTDRGLCVIVMDGENAWEYFEDNGRAFFETLYANLDKQENISSTTISDFLDLESPKKVLNNVFPGSWISHNFEIWIGQEQDNLSWKYLDKVREDLATFTKELHRDPRVSASDIKQAWRELYIAEGSDWNWWYGGKAHTGKDNPFDRLYREHLKNIYRLLRKPIPEFLKISIA